MTKSEVRPVGMLPLWLIAIMVVVTVIFPIDLNLTRDQQLTMASVVLFVAFVLFVAYIYIDHKRNKKLEG